MKLLIDKDRKIKDSIIYLKLYKLFKSYLLLVSDQKDMGIGDVSLSTPSTIEGIKASSSSFHLFGADKKLLSTIISEKISNELNSPLLLLLFIRKKFREEEIAKPLLRFINDILEEVEVK
jgi:hypothetical protein